MHKRLEHSGQQSERFAISEQRKIKRLQMEKRNGYAENGEEKTPRQIADELVAEGLVKWAPSRPGHGMEIVGTSVPEAEPKMTIEEFREKYKSQDLTKPGRCLGITSSYPGRGHLTPKRTPDGSLNKNRARDLETGDA